MSDQLGLDLPGLPPPVPPEPELSRSQRLTAHNRDLIADGVHPTGRLLMEQPDVERPLTCGDCAEHVMVGHGTRNWYKCPHHRLGMSRSENSDIRLKWPACVKFRPHR